MNEQRIPKTIVLQQPSAAPPPVSLRRAPVAKFSISGAALATLLHCCAAIAGHCASLLFGRAPAPTLSISVSGPSFSPSLPWCYFFPLSTVPLPPRSGARRRGGAQIRTPLSVTRLRPRRTLLVFVPIEPTTTSDFICVVIPRENFFACPFVR